MKYTNSFILMLKEAARAVGLRTDSQVFKVTKVSKRNQQAPGTSGRRFTSSSSPGSGQTSSSQSRVSARCYEVELSPRATYQNPCPDLELKLRGAPLARPRCCHRRGGREPVTWSWRETLLEELFTLHHETGEIHSPGVPGEPSQAWYYSKYFFNNYLHE